MRSMLNRMIGVLLVLAAILGMLFSLSGLAAVWVYKPAIAESLAANVVLAQDTITATSAGLVIAEQSLETSIASTSALEEALEAIVTTVDATTPLIDSLSQVTEEDLPAALESAQTSLASAQESARIIDNVLNALDALPGINYNPPVPLHTALAQVATSLEPLSGALITIDESLTTSESNVELIQSDISMIALDIQEIRASLEEAQVVIREYQELITLLQGRVDRTAERLPDWIDLTAWILTFVLASATMTQVGLLLQGWTLLQRRR